MKSVILLTVISFLNLDFIHAQSPLELEVVKQLNIYRKKHGIKPVVYDVEISKVALYHTNYIKECRKVGHNVNKDKLPHDEQYDIKNYKELNFEQRASMAPDKSIWGEIMIAAAMYNKATSIESIAKDIIKSFDSSPNHKDIMLQDFKFITLVGVSIIKSGSNVGPNNDEYIINIDFGDMIPDQYR